MEVGVCTRCGTRVPEAAVYCWRCGDSLLDEPVRGRRGTYAVQSTEGVLQLAFVSTLMPHTTRQTGTRYRWALLLATGLVLLFTAVGILPAAIFAAALAVPVVLLLYLYDLNVWEDTPVPVVSAVLLVTGVLAAGVSFLFYRGVLRDEFYEMSGPATLRAGLAELPVGPFLAFVVLLPFIAVVVMNVGPVYLAARPRFDDMIDGFTFGVAAGSAYAAVETIVAFWAVFSGDLRTTDGVNAWIPVILSLMIVKAMVYATATGIAVAAFSGKGEGYDGFTPSYFANVGGAVVAIVAYWGGIRLLAYADAAQWLGLLWGTVVLSLLVVRARTMLHTALLEAALEGRRRRAPLLGGGIRQWLVSRL